MTDSFAVRDDLQEAIDIATPWLDPATIGYARDFVDAGEYVLAIELLCDQLYEYEIPLTSTFCRLIEQASREMRYGSHRLDALRSLPERSGEGPSTADPSTIHDG
jgi:hypothetical protein